LKKYTDRYYPESDLCFKVTANRVEYEDGTCALVSVTPESGGHIVKLNCHSADPVTDSADRIEHWWLSEGSGSTRERRMSYGWRLYIREDEPPPAPAPPAPWCESAESCGGVPMKPMDTSPKP
jgi:hypothetical protein